MNNLDYINQLSCIDCHHYRQHMAGSQFYRNPCMAFLLKGTAEFLYEGKKHEVNEGDLIYIARGTKYYSMWIGEPEIHFYSIRFNFINTTKYDDYPFQIIHCNQTDKELLKGIMENFETKALKSLGFLYIFLEELYPRLQLNDRKKRDYEIILPALKYIDLNYAEKFSVLHLANLCHLSESHFFSVFKKIMDCSPIEYKNNILIQKSFDLLSSTNKTIEEISYELGFSYPSYFRKVFKSLTGKNPKDVRNNN